MNSPLEHARGLLASARSALIPYMRGLPGTGEPGVPNEAAQVAERISAFLGDPGVQDGHATQGDETRLRHHQAQAARLEAAAPLSPAQVRELGLHYKAVDILTARVTATLQLARVDADLRPPVSQKERP